MNWLNVPADYKNYFGFVYLITNKVNDRLYIGKKQSFFDWIKTKLVKR